MIRFHAARDDNPTFANFKASQIPFASFARAAIDLTYMSRLWQTVVNALRQRLEKRFGGMDSMKTKSAAIARYLRCTALCCAALRCGAAPSPPVAKQSTRIIKATTTVSTLGPYLISRRQSSVEITGRLVCCRFRGCWRGGGGDIVITRLAPTHCTVHHTHSTL